MCLHGTLAKGQVGARDGFLATYLDVVGRRPLAAPVNEKARLGPRRRRRADDLEPRRPFPQAPSICGLRHCVYGRLRRGPWHDPERRLFAGRRAEAMMRRFRFDLILSCSSACAHERRARSEEVDRHLPDLRAEEAKHVFDDAPPPRTRWRGYSALPVAALNKHTMPRLPDSPLLLSVEGQ